MRVFLDTNVLLDLFANRPEFYGQAVRLKAMAYFGDAELWASAKSLTDIFYVMRRSFPSSDIQKLFLASREYLNLCSIEGADIYEACNRCWDDFEDCLVALAAEKVKADVLVTRDACGFADSSVPVFSPAEFTCKMEKEYGFAYDELLA